MIDDRHLLSPTQQRMWTIQQLEPQNNAYNLCTAVRLSGALDPILVREAISLLVDRHESLRTTFFIEEEVPYRRVNPVQSVDVPLVDIEHLSGSKQREQVRAVAAREGSKPFALRCFEPRGDFSTDSTER